MASPVGRRGSGDGFLLYNLDITEAEVVPDKLHEDEFVSAVPIEAFAIQPNHFVVTGPDLSQPGGPRTTDDAFLIYNRDNSVAAAEPDRLKVEIVSAVEYVTPLEAFSIHHDRFQVNGIKEPDSIEIVVEGRPIRIFGLNEEDRLEEFEKVLGKIVEPSVDIHELKKGIDRYIVDELNRNFKEERGLVELVPRPYALRRALEQLPEGSRKQAEAIFRILDKSEYLLDTLYEPFTALETVEKILGEELYKLIFNRITVKWKIPKDNVPKLKELVKASGVDETPFKTVLEDRDHIIEEDFFVFLIPVTMKDELEWPRVEKIKHALRIYFRIENMVANVSEETLFHLKKFKKSLSDDGKTQFLETLIKGSTKADRLSIFDSLHLNLDLTIEERLSFLEVLETFLPEENELLMAPLINVPQDDDDLAIEPLEMDEDGFDLNDLDASAMHSLEASCFEAKVQVVFKRRGRGKDIYLGAPQNKYFDVSAYVRELHEEACPPSPPVVVDEDFGWKSDDDDSLRAASEPLEADVVAEPEAPPPDKDEVALNVGLLDGNPFFR